MNSKRFSQPSSSTPRPVTQEQIAALAHEIWRERGSPEGSDIDIWLEAERQLNGMPLRQSPPKGKRDGIPADPERIDTDEDPAINPGTDRELRNIGSAGDVRSPTAFGP